MMRYAESLDLRLSPLVDRREFESLRDVLFSLSHSQFRMAGIMIRERYAPRMDSSSFWTLAKCLVKSDAKAFLVTILKAVVLRVGNKVPFVYDDGFKDFCGILNDVDKDKLLVHLLPVTYDDKEVLRIFSCIGFEDRRRWLQPLMCVSSLPCYYVLFCSLRTIEDDRAYLVRMALYLIKKGDSMSFNMACLIKEYFALDEVKGTFSLKLNPYQFSCVETSYEAFCKLMNI